MKAYQFLPLLIAAALAGCGQKEAPVADVAAPVIAAVPSTPTPAPAPTPAPTPVTAAASAPASAPDAARLAAGEKIYSATCLACHGAAVLGAPKLGDKTAWGPRLAQGMDTLYANSQNGVRMMPARGGNASLTDDEMKSAVDFMVSKI